MLQGVIFDMDGVLLDTERPHIQIDIDLAAEMGYTLPDSLQQSFFGSTDGQIRRLVRETLGEGFDYDYFSRESHRRADALVAAEGVPLKPQARPLLEALRARGIPCALASSSFGAVVRKNLGSVGLLGYFDVVVGGDEAPASKPAPDIFLLAAQKLGLPPGSCLAIEDSYNGVRSAASAGCVTVMVPDVLPANDEMRALAAAVLPDLAGVLDFFDLYNDANNQINSNLF